MSQIDKPSHRVPQDPTYGSLPQDPEAESAVLSAMMLSEDVLQDCLIDLSDDDFFSPAYREVFLTMREMFDKSLPIDSVSIADYLKTKGRLESVGGRSFLLGLFNNTLSLVGWQHHIDILRRDTTLRRIIAASAQITALAYDAPEDTREVVDRAEKMLLDVTARDVRKNEQSIEEIMIELYEELGNAENGQLETSIPTGFPTLDKTLLGLQPGQLIVVGARPGVGKTSLALNIAVNAAAFGACVALFSLEMSKREIAQRLLASRAHVGLQDIRSGRIKTELWPQILKATDELSGLDIMIDDTSGTTVTEIRAKARRILHNKPKGLVVVDYLQLVSPPLEGRRSDTRANEVSEMSRNLKIMAKDLGVPVIAASQLNRLVENRTGRRPQLSDLRESGSIEQDADIVALLDRSMTQEEALRDDRPNLNETKLIIAKNRSGALGEISLTFIPGSTTFVEVDKFHDDQP